jgi:hypothetical protein
MQQRGWEYAEEVYHRDLEWRGGRGGPECANDPPDREEKKP